MIIYCELILSEFEYFCQESLYSKILYILIFRSRIANHTLVQQTPMHVLYVPQKSRWSLAFSVVFTFICCPTPPNAFPPFVENSKTYENERRLCESRKWRKRMTKMKRHISSVLYSNTLVTFVV